MSSPHRNTHAYCACAEDTPHMVASLCGDGGRASIKTSLGQVLCLPEAKSKPDGKRLGVADTPWLELCHDLVPDLVPKYLVTVGTRWYLLGVTAAPLYQRVPTSTNSHKHNQDSNSLGGTIVCAGQRPV